MDQSLIGRDDGLIGGEGAWYGPDQAAGLRVKRAFDLVGSVTLMAMLSPAFLGISALLLIAQGRPILFRQRRVGLHGTPFWMFKFRTMSPDAEDSLAALESQNEIRGQAFKLTADPRVSRVGRVLRRTSLDELPQLWNVMTGSMSLVGPRPPLPREVDAYRPWHRRRLDMKPGVTGLWQVSARREVDFDRWVAVDVDYIEHWSMWLDFLILLRTIPAIMSGR